MFTNDSGKRILAILFFFVVFITKAQVSTLPIYQSDYFSIFSDSVVQNHFVAKAISTKEIISNYKTNSQDNIKDNTAIVWTLSKDIDAFPQYHSSIPIADAIYNLSLEEMVKAVEKDSTFRTGKEWGGAWTRDISYSIIHSMAYLQPEVAKKSLLKKVNKKKRIIQDTGTGGAYPCSTDRIIWAVAAWELYKSTGDKEWLKQAYEIIKNSIDDDLQNIYDSETGLVRGESSFLDWREETYPTWMEPADIFESECLGTNAVHYQANIILSKIAGILKEHEAATKYKLIAVKIKEGINKYLWIPEKKYYGQYLYGRNYKIVSPKSEALGEALAVIFGIADTERAKEIISNTPVTAYGISCIYPQIPGIPPYHNNANWPFVQAYWLRAAAKAGNENAVLESIADIYRPAALFLTNKENMVTDNGDYSGTQINSSVMLWSLSGNISIVHKILFGISFNEDNLSFNPYVPKSMSGKRTLNNFKYRNAILNIELNGYGNHIKSFTLDGKPLSVFVVPSDLKGNHFIKIELANNDIINSKINKVANYTTLQTPELLYENNSVNWKKNKDAKEYKLIDNGKTVEITAKNNYPINDTTGFHEYSLVTIDSNNVESFASMPLNVFNNSSVKYEIEHNNKSAKYPYIGFSGSGYVEISTTINRSLNIPIEINEKSTYSIDFKYSNGNGPINTENKCAVRTLKIDNQKAGTFVFPQRGTNDWNNWGFSNAILSNLNKGSHILTLTFDESDENMNGEINAAMLDFVRVTKLHN